MSEISARKLNVMIVDDDPSIVRLLTTLLKQEFDQGLHLHELTDPHEARAWIESHCCDILISDIEMPGLDGLELLKAAKGRNAWTQVVFITAHSSLDRLTEALEWGASDYLLKPLDRQEVLEVVGQLALRCARWQSAVIGTFATAVR
jgi:DNA-binding NtrC family response regulator